MASARKKMVEKTRMVEEKYTEADGVVLELNQTEADLLAAILGFKTGGDSEVLMGIYRPLKHQVAVYGPGVTETARKISGMLKVVD